MVPASEQPLGAIAEQNLADLAQFDPDDVLLSYQKAWIADQAVWKIAEKSRRTGLTWAEAADAALAAASARNAGGTNHFYIGTQKEMAREFIEAAAMWSKAFDHAASQIDEAVFEEKGREGREILVYTIYYASGHKVQALSSSPANMRGMQGNVTLDEAAHQEQLPELIKAAAALTMWGAKVRIISTHNGVDSAFNDRIEETRAGKRRDSLHRITLDDACTQGLYRRICQIRGLGWSQEAEAQWKQDLLADTSTREDALEEYYCVPKQGGGAYLSRALIESRMVDTPVLHFEASAEFNAAPDHVREADMQDWCEKHLRPLLAGLDPNLQHSFGEDFGRTADLTVFSPLEISQDLKRRTPFMVELRNVPFRQQEQVMVYIINRLPRFLAGHFDARGNGQYLAERAVQKYGENRIEAVMITQSWYLDSAPKFKAALEDDELHIAKDVDVLDDLRALQVIKGIPKIPEGKTGNQKNRHGDAAISLIMAYMASLAEVEEYAYEAVTVGSDPAPRPVKSGLGLGGLRGGML